MITRFRKHTGEKGLGGLFEPFLKPKNSEDIPAAGVDLSGIPTSEPSIDNRSVPPEVSDPPWLV